MFFRQGRTVSSKSPNEHLSEYMYLYTYTYAGSLLSQIPVGGGDERQLKLEAVPQTSTGGVHKCAYFSYKAIFQAKMVLI